MPTAGDLSNNERKKIPMKVSIFAFKKSLHIAWASFENFVMALYLLVIIIIVLNACAYTIQFHLQMQCIICTFSSIITVWS